MIVIVLIMNVLIMFVVFVVEHLAVFRLHRECLFLNGLSRLHHVIIKRNTIIWDSFSIDYY